MSILFDNNASGTNSIQVEIIDTTIDLQANEGQLFPSVLTISGDFFMLTLEDTAGEIEICRCTNNESDQLTVSRAEENTTAKQFLVGSKVEQRMTAGAIDEFVLRTGATMTGTLNMNGEEITDPVLLSTGSGEINGFKMRGQDAGSANELVVPSGGGNPTIGDAPAEIIAVRPWVTTYATTTYVPLVRTITGGEGIAAMGDLNVNRTVDLAINELTTKLGAAMLPDDQFLMWDNTSSSHKVIDYRDAGIPIVTVSGQTITPTSDSSNAMFVCTHSAAAIDFVLNDDVGQVGNFFLIQMADPVRKVTVSGTAIVNCAVPFQRTIGQWSVIVLLCTSDTAGGGSTHEWALYGDVE